MAGTDRREPAGDGRRRKRDRFGLGLGLALALIAGTAGARPTAQGASRQELLAEYDRATLDVKKGRLRAAAERLEAVIERDEPQGKMALLFHVRAAELRVAVRDWNAALTHLETVDALADDKKYSRQQRAFAAGIRGQLHQSAGQLDLARQWLETSQALLERLQGEGVDVGMELRALYQHRVGLALACNDIDELEGLKPKELAGSALFAPDSSMRANLLVRYARGLNEAERRDPDRERLARGIAEDALEVSGLAAQEWMNALMTLAEIDLREGDAAAAQARLDAVEAEIATAGLGPESRVFTRWATLAARRARTAGEPAELAAARAALDRAFEAFLDRWRVAELRPGGYGILQYGESQTLLSERILTALALDGEEAGARLGLGDIVRVQALGSLCRELGCAETDLERLLAEAIGDRRDRGLLFYLPSDERTHLLLADARGVQHFELPQPDHVEDARVRVIVELEDPRRTPVRRARLEAALAELGELLLPAGARTTMRGWRSCTVVGLDLFRVLPFESLPFEGGTVGTELAVDAAPSLPLIATLARRAPAELRSPPLRSASETGPQRSAASDPDGAPGVRADGLWLLADPEPHEGHAAPPLGLDAGTLEDLAAAFPAEARSVLTGPDATVERLSDPGLADAFALGILAHGVRDRTREESQGLALTPTPDVPDGVLWCSRVDTLPGVPPLVVLAACRAGRSPLRRGDAGSADLAGAFLARGASAVLASDFDLDVEAARRLSRDFLHHVARGQTPAEALRRAREALAQDERFADPYHAGALRIVGLGQRPLAVRPETDRRAAWLAAGAGLVLVGALAVRGSLRRRDRRRRPEAPAGRS